VFGAEDDVSKLLNL